MHGYASCVSSSNGVLPSPQTSTDVSEPMTTASSPTPKLSGLASYIVPSKSCKDVKVCTVHGADTSSGNARLATPARTAASLAPHRTPCQRPPAPGLAPPYRRGPPCPPPPPAAALPLRPAPPRLLGGLLAPRRSLNPPAATACCIGARPDALGRSPPAPPTRASRARGHVPAGISLAPLRSAHSSPT